MFCEIVYYPKFGQAMDAYITYIMTMGKLIIMLLFTFKI